MTRSNQLAHCHTEHGRYLYVTTDKNKNGYDTDATWRLWRQRLKTIEVRKQKTLDQHYNATSKRKVS